MDRLAFFLGKWKGKGVIIEKGMNYIEETSYSVVITEPAIVISA